MELGVQVIRGFLIQKSGSADVREIVTDQADRLAMKYPYKGLVTRQTDTGQLFRYITTTPVDGSLPSNLVTDWELVLTIFTQTGAPAGTKGVIGDIYIDETA